MVTPSKFGVWFNILKTVLVRIICPHICIERHVNNAPYHANRQSEAELHTATNKRVINCVIANGVQNGAMR